MEQHRKVLMTASEMKLRGDWSVDKELDVGKQWRLAKETKPSLWVSEQMPPHGVKSKILRETKSGASQKAGLPVRRERKGRF